MRHGDLLLLAAILLAIVVMFVVYTIIVLVRKNTMDNIYRDGAVSPSGSEWETGKCEMCKKEKPLHIGYGQCYACIHGAE